MLFSLAFIRRPVMAVAINCVLLIVGLVSFRCLELRHKPNLAQNDIRITTIYPGANCFAVEQQVTKPLEDTLAGIDGIKKLSSTSQDSLSEIHIKFKSGTDNYKALSQVRDRIFSAVSGLPESVKRPEIHEQSEENAAIMYLIFEDNTRSVPVISDYIRRVVEDRLRLVEGIAKIGHYGNQLYMVSIKLDPALLAEHQITVKEVVDALRRERTYASGGEIEGVTAKESVVLTAMVTKPQDFANVTIKVRPYGRVILQNVATISVAEKPTFLKLRVNGQYKVGLEIFAKPQANPLEVAKQVHHFVEDLKKTMPASMKAWVNYDATKPFEAAFIEMRHTLWEGIFLVGIIVTLSLASVRAAVLPMITVPLCLIGTFGLMWLLGFSINPITLLALILAVGLVVDDAIVVVENIYRAMEEGFSALDAAKRSMKEISFAIVVMTITLAAVYLPLVFQIDDSAVVFREFAWTLAGSVIISGFVALTLMPALCGKFLKESKRIVFWDLLTLRYRTWLEIALQYPGRMCATLILIALLGFVGFQRLSSELMPREDEGYIFGSINADNAVSEVVQESWFKDVERALQSVPEHERVMTGVWQDRWMWWALLLKPNSERSRSSFEIMDSLRPQLNNIVGPGVYIGDNAGLDDSDSLKIILQYSGEPEPLTAVVNQIMAEIRKQPGFESVNSEQTWEKQRLKVIVDRPLAAELGIGIDAIEDTLYTLLSGRKAADFNFQGLDYDVQVRAPKELRSELNHLNAYFVANAEGQWVPLGSLITLKEVIEHNQIKRYERMRGAAIQIALQPDMPLDQALGILEPIVKKYCPEDMRYRFAGKAEKYREAKNAMWLTFSLAIAFIYLVLAALFESFVHPFIVLLTVPLSVAGAVWAVRWSGGTNNIYTSIGLVTLVGLITKHGILIVDFANRLLAQGRSLREAVLMAAEFRLRPVLMTTFAMICGAVPLLFSVGAGAIARKSIGWVIIGGMLTGTFFSLFVIPVIYSLISQMRNPLKKHT